MWSKTAAKGFKATSFGAVKSSPFPKWFAWPAPVLPLMNAPAPASTVTWMVDIVGAIDGEPDAWWRFAADTVAANGGHASVEARLWGSDGALVAVSRQLVAEFSRP